jgi:hypothetical protein
MGSARAKKNNSRRTSRTVKGFVVRKRRKRPISDAKLERALTVLADTKDIRVAARSIRVSQKKLKRSASRQHLIRKNGNEWKVVGGLQRRMLVYSDGRPLILTLPGIKTARFVGKYMAAVGRFLRTNQIKHIKPYAGLTFRDASGKRYPLETNPNALYRLASTGDASFEAIYRIVV